MSQICATRAMKNIKRIRSVAPDIFGAQEPLEGFASVIPFDILNRFHRMTSDQLSGYPRLQTAAELLKQRDAQQAPAIVPHGLIFSDPPFQGTIYLVQLTFQVGSNSIFVDDTDMAVILQYLTNAAPRISKYCRQYGDNSLNISNRILKMTVSVPSGTYNEDTLDGWLQQILAKQTPAGRTCVIILNPNGVVNSDGALSNGIGGYHSSVDFKRAPSVTAPTETAQFCFVNVTGQGLTISDRDQFYARNLSHEVAEMVVDPFLSHTNPEVCDGCAFNCISAGAWLSFFAINNAGGYNYGGSFQGVPLTPFDFYISAIVQSSHSDDCPAPGSACSYAPPSTPTDTSELQLVGVGNDGHLWHTIRIAAGWSGIGYVEGVAPGGPATFLDIASGCADGQALDLQMVGVGNDGNLWHTLRKSDGSWDGFGLVEEVAAGGPAGFKAISCAGTQAGLQVVGIGNDGKLWHTIRTPTVWSGFGLIEQVAKGGPPTFVDIACTSRNGRDLQVVGVGSDGKLWMTTRLASGGWTVFSTIESVDPGGPATFKRVSCAGTGSGLQVVGVGNDNNLWHTLQSSSTNQWSGIGFIKAVVPGGPPAFTDVSCATSDGVSLQVVGVGNDGNLWHTIRNGDGSWIGFGYVEGSDPGGPASFKAISCAGTPAQG